MNDRIFSYNKNKDYDRIAEIAANMVPLDCFFPEEAHIIAKAYEKLNAFSQSLVWYKREYELMPSDEILGAVIGIYLTIRKFDDAKAFLSSAASDRNGFYYRAACCELAFRTGASDAERIECLESFLDIQYEETYMLRLAMLYINSGREKEASRLCKKVIRLFISGSSVDYAEKLLESIKNGNASSFILTNPWTTDSVFKHISFDLNAAPPKDIFIGKAPDNSKAAPSSAEKPLEKSASPAVSKEKEEKPKAKIPMVIRSSMENVIGMDSLRTRLNDILNLIQAGKKRAAFDSVFKNNLVIVGPDGSGKTTAAMAACRALCKLGITDSEEPVIADYYELMGKDDTETHDNITELFRKAENSCILIDNIHEYDHSSAYPKELEILDMLVKAHKAAEGKVPFIITGNESEVNDLLGKKKQLAALFDLPHIVLDGYTVDELTEIAAKIAEDKGFILCDEASAVLKAKLEYLSGQSDFMYSKTLEQIIGNALISQANRISKKRHPSEKDCYVITAEDLGEANDTETVEELLAELDNMTGLKEVKEQVHKLVNHIKFKEIQQSRDIRPADTGTLHLVFAGNAGTGKTTVARLLGRIYKKLGVLPSGHLVECTRRDLVAQFVGGTAPLVRDKVNEAMGGILFIDEAYTLCKDQYDTYGKEAIDSLLTDIENNRDSFMVILAGYSDDMEKFMDQNQGLRSRIPTKITFEDYTVDEMVRIFTKNISDRGRILDVGLENEVRSLIESQSKKKDFGNARGIRNLTDAVILNMENRVCDMDASSIFKNDLLIIRKQDITSLNKGSEGRKTVLEYLDELNSLTGLASVKEKVSRIVASVKMNKDREALGIGSNGYGTLHMVFKGNAGTGKTTVARIIGNIYRELGVLKTGQLIECGRSDLVAGYSGQTALKTKAKIQEAVGGVLFIDEAYALAGDSYGKEAIDTLVADIENLRSELMVIIAGYSEDMDIFLSQNQGLSSRFPNEIIFEDYSVDEMVSIFKNMISANKLMLDSSAEPIIRQIIGQRASASDFGNARGVRNLTQEIMENQNLRLYKKSISGECLTEQDYRTITKDDILVKLCEG